MAHWAQIDENNTVIQIVKINDNEYTDEGYNWIVENLGGNWIKTSINTKGGVHYGADGQPDNGTPLRKNYAFIGGKYDKDRDAFIAPKPETLINKNNKVLLDFVWNEEACTWDPITPY